MEKRIRERYSDSVLHEALQRYGVAEDRVRLLDGFESFIYEFERDGGEYILRIGHDMRRSQDMVQGEMDWIEHLAKGGAGVAQPIRSLAGRRVEPIPDGRDGSFLATAFVKARGKTPEKAERTEALFEHYGQVLGRMHALAGTYEPADPAWRRPEWDDAEMLEVAGYLPAGEERVVERFEELMAGLNQLPRDDRSTYDLIHQDAHMGNLFVDSQGRITIFDFDDCTYSWFVNDIAIVLFYAVMGAEDAAAFTDKFMRHFLRGYQSEVQIDPQWLVEIPHFLKLREIDLYAIIHRSFDVENLADSWNVRYMKDRKKRIEAGRPYIEFDFAQLSNYV